MTAIYEWISHFAVSPPMWLISAMTGGVAGQVVAWCYNARRQRLDLALSLTSDFMARYDDFSGVLGLLRGPIESVTDYNKVHAFGDWLEILSVLVSKKYAHRGLLDSIGVLAQARRFRTDLDAAIGRGHPLKSAREAWVALAQL